MKDRIMIIGASGHGRVVADIAKLNGYQEILFLDDDETIRKNGIYDVAGTTKDIDQYKVDYDFIIAIGNNVIRRRIAELLLKKEVSIPVLIHPSAVIDKTAAIDEGTVVMANAVINADTRVGKHCIINTAATIDHDNVIEDYVHISPGAHLAGTVHIGEGTWIGIGSQIINNLNVGANCIIGAGSVVIKDISQSGTYIGVPTKRIV